MDPKVFIGYKGSEFNQSEIENELKKYNKDYYGNYDSDYIIKTYANNKVILSKTVRCTYPDDREPRCHNDIYTVNEYSDADMQRVIREFGFDITDNDKNHIAINAIYVNYNTNFLKKIKDIVSEDIALSTVLYDENDDKLIAGRLNNANLFYGLTFKNNELMLSNNKNILKKFCTKVYTLGKNKYICNNNIYNLNGDNMGNIFNNEDEAFIQNNQSNSNTFFNALNAVLNQISNDTFKAKVEAFINNYLKQDSSKQKIEEFIDNELDNEVKKEILTLIKKIIKEMDEKKQVKTALNETFDQVLKEYQENVTLPVCHIVKLNDTVLGQTNGGYYHAKFEQILTQTQLDEPIMLIGPAGSGKNVAVSQVAQALGLKMYYTNNASNEFKLTGFIDAGGNYRDTEFYKAFKNGGLFFLDEIDNSDPSALIVINSALANGYMAFPHETIDRHPNFRIVAAANTWGKGSDLQYVGRQALDGATLDRFDNIFFDYDRKLESLLYPKDDVLEFMWAFRDSVFSSNIPHIVSTRGIGKVYKKDINNLPVEDILTSNVVKNLNQDDINMIIGNMKNVSSSNKYFDGIKKLRLNR